MTMQMMVIVMKEIKAYFQHIVITEVTLIDITFIVESLLIAKNLT